MLGKISFKGAAALVALLSFSSCTPHVALGASSDSAQLLGRLGKVRLGYHLSGLLDFAPSPGAVIRAAMAPQLPSAEPFRGADAASGAALECLTAAVYYEARSEGPSGQRAVAQVVLNRVRHAAFPNSICGVVFQGANLRTGCQFSFTCDGSMRRRREDHAWRAARAIAEDALNGHVEPSVGLATHYHPHAVSPFWAPSLRPLASVGDHIFYTWQGGAGEPAAFRRRAVASRPASAPRPASPSVQMAAVHNAPTESALGALPSESVPPPAVVETQSADGTPGFDTTGIFELPTN